VCLTVDADVPAGATLANQARVQAYYSKPSTDSVERRQYAATEPVGTDVTTVGIAWRPDHQQTTQPDTTIVYAHRFDAQLGAQAGTLSIAVDASQAIGWVLYADTNGNGRLDDGDARWTDGSTVGTGSLLIFAKGHIPADAPDGWVDVTTLTATLTVAGTPHVRVVTDITRVAGDVAGEMVGTKEAALDTDCDGSLTDESPANQTFTAAKAIQPGQCAVYRIRFSHQGTGALSEVSIHDQTPPFTTYVGGSAAYETTPAGLTPGVINTPAHGSSGPLVWPYTGSMLPGAGGSVTYEVQVDE
jgi:hypothetical protein